MRSSFFSISENGENGLGDEGADGGNPPEFLARTAPVSSPVGSSPQPTSMLVYSERDKTLLTAIITWIYILKSVKLLIKFLPLPKIVLRAFVATVDRDRRP